jgi:hypothetical protein
MRAKRITLCGQGDLEKAAGSGRNDGPQHQKKLAAETAKVAGAGERTIQRFASPLWIEIRNYELATMALVMHIYRPGIEAPEVRVVELSGEPSCWVLNDLLRREDALSPAWNQILQTFPLIIAKLVAVHG